MTPKQQQKEPDDKMLIGLERWVVELSFSMERSISKYYYETPFGIKKVFMALAVIVTCLSILYGISLLSISIMFKTFLHVNFERESANNDMLGMNENSEAQFNRSVSVDHTSLFLHENSINYGMF